MSKFFDVPSRRVKIATLTLGAGLNADADTRVDMTAFDGWRSPIAGQRPVLLALEHQVSGNFTTANGSAALRDMFLQYMLDLTTLKGAGGIELARATKGWHRWFWNYLQRGDLRGLFARDVAANSSGSLANYTRTFSQFVDFVEHRSSDPYARCWPLECFTSKGSGAEYIVRMKSAAKVLFKSSAAVTLGFSAGTLTIYAHVSDVPASKLRIPVTILERAITGDSRVNPTPGPGAYLRLLVGNSPAPADNPGAEDDNLSAYTQIDYFGVAPGNLTIVKEDVAGYMQRAHDEISEEPRPVLDDPTQYKASAYLFNPLANFDGHLRALPLAYLRSGEDVRAVRVFKDDPKLGANGDDRTGLPQAINFLTQEVVPRDAAQMKAILSSIPGATMSKARPDPRYAGADPSRTPWIVDVS